jgi:hypothetical protein
LRIRGHETARDDARPERDWWGADEHGAQGHDLQIVIEVLPQAAAECAASDAREAFAIVADAPQVAPRLVGKEDVCPQVDPLRCALQASAEAGEGPRSMAASMVTSTSASFGTGFSVASEPIRAIRRTLGSERPARTNASTAPSR